MVLSLGLAVLVLITVALPRVRSGARLLSPDGEEQVREARRRAAVMSRQARVRAAATAGDVRARSTTTAAGSPAGPGADPAEATRADVTASAAPPATATASTASATAPAATTRPTLRGARAAETLHKAWQRMDWGEPRPGPRHARRR